MTFALFCICVFLLGQRGFVFGFSSCSVPSSGFVPGSIENVVSFAVFRLFGRLSLSLSLSISPSPFACGFYRFVLAGLGNTVAVNMCGVFLRPILSAVTFLSGNFLKEKLTQIRPTLGRHVNMTSKCSLHYVDALANHI